MEEQSNERTVNKALNRSKFPDRLSELPDSLVHHILSFLPETRDAIRTGLLSKRWRNQWRHVPILIFSSSDYREHSEAIDNVLNQYEPSNLEKFSIVWTYPDDPHFDRRIRFAVGRHVKELILYTSPRIKVPEILFRCASLVKLHANCCLFAPNEKVSWSNLKELRATHCKFLDRGLEHVLSGCPLLESLFLSCALVDRLTLASQSLRKLTLYGLQVRDDIALSCPNLEELDFQRLPTRNNDAIARGDSITVLHPTVRYTKGVLAVTSESLKKLRVRCLGMSRLEGSCPALEELELCGSCRGTVIVVVKLNPSVIVSLVIEDFSRACMKLLLQLQHVKELKFVRWFIDISLGLDGWEKSNRPTRLLRNKHLTLHYPCFNEIELALLVFHVLEKLVIKFPSRVWRTPIDFLELDDAEENYWSRAPYLNCLASHLKYVELIFLHTFHTCERALSLIEFLLKKSGVLKKMVIVFKNCDKGFAKRVSRRAATFPRLSKDAVVEFSRSNLLDFEYEDFKCQETKIRI